MWFLSVNVKFSHTLYQALGPELILVYRQSAHRWLFKSSMAVGCHYFLWSPFQPMNVTVLQPVPSYTAWWQRHVGVNNFPKVAAQPCHGDNCTHGLTIASPMLYGNATVFSADRECFVYRELGADDGAVPRASWGNGQLPEWPEQHVITASYPWWSVHLTLKAETQHC